MVGMLLFGLIADIDVSGVEHGGYRLALAVQIVTMAAGLVLIWLVRVDDATG
jgi:hypothetical protein